MTLQTSDAGEQTVLADLEFDFDLLALDLWIGMSPQLAKEIQAMMRAPLSTPCALNGMGDEL